MMQRLWRLWAKALGEKASSNNLDADRVAIIRTVIMLIYLITNIVIMAGVVRHWNDEKQDKQIVVLSGAMEK